MTLLARGVRHAARRLRRAPAFTVAAVGTLALGIGAVTTVFGVVDAILLRPLPYARSRDLVDVSHTLEISGLTHVDQSDATYLFYRRASRVFTDVGAYRAAAANLGPTETASADRGEAAERVASARVSASTFRVLQVAPVLGRAFREDDDRPGSAPVAIIGHRLWQRKYGADPSIVGRRIDVDGVAHEVIGVMPPRFGFPDGSTALWTPVALDPARTASAAFDYRVVARLRDGRTAGDAVADLQRLLPQVPEAFPGRLTAAAIEQTRMRVVVRPLRDVVVGDVGRVLWVVLGAVAFVLAVACANVANLFLIRARSRRRELAVRRALGAAAPQLAGEIVAEAALVAATGAALGAALAVAGTRALRATGAAVALPRLEELGVDGAALAVCAAAAVLSALLVSALPVLRARSLPLADALAESSRSTTSGREGQRARRALVAAQLAFALVLLNGAALMARSFAQLRAVETGFDDARAFTFRLALPPSARPATGDVTGLIDRVAADLAALPGVTAVGVTTKLPLDPVGRRDTALFVADRAGMGRALPAIHQASYVGPGYFDALRIPVVEGRAFARPDPARPQFEVIVSRRLARRYWGDAPAVGRLVRLHTAGPWLTVVGVVGDVRGTALEEPPDEMVYLPLVTAPGATTSVVAPGAAWAPRDVAFVVRSADRATNSAMVRAPRVVLAAAPDVPVYGARPMSEIVARSAARTTFTLLLLGVASAVALALGTLGVYGVISYVVSLQTREIAVRLSLGARLGHIARLVAAQAVSPVAWGLGAGVLGAAALARVLGALLFGVAATDPVALVASVALLLAAAAAASWLPARRAARTNPARALAVE